MRSHRARPELLRGLVRRAIPPGAPLAAPALLLALLIVGSAGAQEGEGGPSPAPVEPIVVEVGARALGPVPGLATSGFNYGNGMLVVGFEDEFEAVRVDTLRFPPGNQADEIRVGRPDLAALAMNLELLGRPPVLMVANLFGGTPEEAAGLARLARELDIPVLAWEIGNEPDLYAENRNDPSWTPERWCDEFRAFTAAIREVDPDARFAGPAVSGARPIGEEYLREVLRGCGDAIDILTWHVYPTDGTWEDEAALATSAQLTQELERYRAWASDPEANPLGFEAPPELGVTEFGLSWRSSSFRHLEDMTAALWLADVLGRMTTGRLDMSHYFTLQGMGGHGLIGTGGWVRPTYHVYAMLSGFTGEALPVTAPPSIGAYAVRGGDVVEVLLVNPHDRAFVADLRVAGSAAGELELATLTEAIFDELGEPEVLAVPAGDPIHVPPRAVVRLSAPAAPR